MKAKLKLLGREDHGSIPTTMIGRGSEPLDVRTDPNQIKLVVVKTKIKIKINQSYSRFSNLSIKIRKLNMKYAFIKQTIRSRNRFT
jgi:hypothetical protein